jgi:hypothetical protein
MGTVMKKTVTNSIDRELLAEARRLATSRDSSLSAILARCLELEVERAKEYERARISAQTRLRSGMKLGWKRPASRDEIHDREGL